MDVTSTLSLGDPLEPARKATAEMLQSRERTFSLPQPFYNDERLFKIDMQEIFHKEWLIAGMTCEIPAKGNYLTLQIGEVQVGEQVCMRLIQFRLAGQVPPVVLRCTE